MNLLTQSITEKLIANGREQADARDKGLPPIDFKPVVKLFNPWGTGTWLLSELYPSNPDIAFGLCDLGFPELGNVSITELENVRYRLNLVIERDRHWKATKTIKAYADEARAAGRVVA